MPMKKIIFNCVLLIFLSMPIVSYAVHDLVFISAIIKLSDTECAVELEIFGDDQNAFQDDDSIKLDGTVLVTLEAVIDAGINDADGNNGTGANILGASPSFEDETGLQADLMFDDSKCADFLSGVVFGFFIDGDTLIDSVDSSEFDDFGKNDTAITKSDNDDEPDFKDLTDSAFRIHNNSNGTVIIGSNTGRKSGIQCSLIKDNVHDFRSSLSFFGLLGSLLLILFTLRVIQKSSP